ncbi:protein RRP5 homolog [Anopheles marshallii]|uniref:protein RRP5 homolog n=1 Tax=Anopheles marshallii TaxID=1521116 RepID=UPI00237A6579|nr:protein RRP5 homolog [Anopheles marshallii]
MVNVEPAFPRGHKEPTHGLTNRIKKPKAAVKHYGATILAEEKTRRLRPEQRRQLVMNEKKTDEAETQQALNASHFTFAKLPNGILTLACVKRITKTGLELILPGRILGYVPISNISEAYCNRLQEMINTGSTDCPSLNDLYNCGDLVYAKLLCKYMGRERKAILSLDPSELHKEFVPSQLVAGLVLAATIVQKEDHGYSMNVGIRNVRAFLSDDNLGQNQDDVGRNLFCSIVSVSYVGSGATVILKAFDPNAPRVLNVEEADMDVIVPGCRLTFTVGEPVEFGLRGMLFEDMVPAYVNENMLTKTTSTPQKYTMFKKIPATLLYVVPVTKQVFVSLKPYTNNRAETNVTNSPGTVIDKAYVKAIDGRGVWLQFGNKQRALLPRNVIMSQAASSGNVDESVVMGNFQIGTSHKVFVVHYDPLENTYMVSNEHYDDEEIRTTDDIIIGNTYKCRVKKIVNGGALVTVGPVIGSLSFGYYNQATPLKIKDTLLVRAVHREIGSSFIKFTNIPELLDEKASILYDWDQLDATKNDQSFLGMVFRITPAIVLVRFFNNICGVLDKAQRKSEMDVAKVGNLRLDTVEKFTVIEFDKATRKTYLTIPNTAEKIRSAIIVNATITCVHASGVDVRTEGGETGTVPSECFSEFGEHNSLYMRLLQEGQTLTVVKTNPGTYSVRLIPYFKTHPMNVESVERGMLLKGSCITVNGVLYVTPLLSNFSEQIEIKTNENYRKVEDGSTIMMRVLNVKKSSDKGYELDVSTGLLNVCEQGIMDVYKFMAEYLKDVNNLVQRYKEAKHAFANYTIGQTVECVIESIVPESNKYAVVVHAIDNKSKYAAKGIATTVVPNQSVTLYKAGERVPGRVIWIDVERKLVQVCLDQSLFECIVLLDEQLSLNLHNNVKLCRVLFANNYIQICCPTSGPPNALLIVPVRHHYNDMINSTNDTVNSLEVRLVKQFGQMILATHERMYKFYCTCRAQARAMIDDGLSQQIAPRIFSNHTLISCRQATDTFHETTMLEEEETDATDQSAYDSDSDTQQEEKETENAEENSNEQQADASYDSSSPITKTNGPNNATQKKKGSASKLSSNGSNKSKLKRSIVADVKESAPREQLPLRKKKKNSPFEETAVFEMLPKKLSKKATKHPSADKLPGEDAHQHHQVSPSVAYQRHSSLVKSEKRKDEAETQQTLNASFLTNDTLQKGMLMLGCVKRITKVDLDLILPGGIIGNVNILDVSDAYSNRLQEMINTGSTDCPSLNDLYNYGDLVYAKFLCSKRIQKDFRMSCFSLNPSELHKEFVPSQLVPGLVLAATIVNKEDYGYSMNVGVHNVRAFLPNENLGQNQDDVGRNLFCSIESVSQGGFGATVILKAFDPNAPRVLNVESAAMETIVPGCRLMFTVGEPVEFGLRGMLFEDMVPAYVNKNMLTKVTSTPQKYTMFKKIPATLLYVMPDTKQVFVSLRPYPYNWVEADLSNRPGTAIDKAYVKAIDGRGVWLQFGNKQRALLPRNVIMRQAVSSDNVDESVVMGNFQIGTSHKVFVLYYDPLENTYVVTNEQYDDVEIHTLEDIIMGKTYKCRVHKIFNGDALVKVGRVIGSLNFGYYNQATPLKIKDTLLVRAVYREIGTPFIKFTNIPELLDEKASILYDWDQLDATKNDQSFLGMVRRITPMIVVVRFFNNISGVLDKTECASEMDVAKVGNLRLDTVEKFTVIEFDKTTRKISLTIPNTAEKIRSAIFVNATITCVHASGVDVRTEGGETGTVPSECFSEFVEHNSLYMRLLQEGQTLTVVKTNPGTYSVRLIPYFKTHPMHVESVERGMLLKGSCITVNGVLYVTPLLSNFSEQIEIKTNENYRKVEDGSTIMMRVLNVKKSSDKGYELDVSTRLQNVCEQGIMDVYKFMAEYLKDVNNLVQRYKEANHAFANYTIGQTVECVIESIIPESNKYAVVVHAIDNKSKYAAKGIATTVVPNQSVTLYKVGERVPARVIWIDVERKLVQVCLDQSLFERIVLLNEQLRVQIPQQPTRRWVLFANNYVRICCLKSGTPNALLIEPVRYHYNDMQHRENDTDNSEKLQLVKQFGQMIFAASHHLMCMFQTVRERGQSKRIIIRCRQATETFDEQFKDKEDESEYDSDSDTQQEEKETENAEENSNEQQADASYDSMDEDEDEEYVYNHDETDDESSPPITKTNGPNNATQKKKGSASKLSSNGSNKSKLKRSIVADVKESAPREQLPLRKKKKISPIEALETAAIAKLPKKQSKKAKKSILLIGEEAKSRKSALKKNISTFVIDQLDGANDFYLAQLDGTEDDHIVPRDSKLGAKKRKRTTGVTGLPGALNFWDSTPVYKRSVSDASDNEADSSDNEHYNSVGKKRSTGKERFEAMKQEEERLRKIEDELANPSADPHTPDQFERLVLAQPNNSMLWIRYMAFHMESAELDKARAVGRKALRAIHFREETDRLNVWMALLNLEIRYETVDTFKEVLQEAVQYNDAFKVYSRAIDILIDCQKHVEVQEFLELLLKKFRKHNDMWFLVADAWYRIGQGDKVKPLLSQALKSLPTREHILMIVKFAFLHNRNDNRDEAHLLFEQILTSYPKRTDIWSQYIDMLVKDNLVGNARQILERAIMQRLPMKNMKTLYTKYVTFEEKHGDRDSVRRVKQMAADYVQSQLNNAGIQ